MVTTNLLNPCLLPPLSHMTVLVVIIVIVYGNCGTRLGKAVRLIAALANLASAVQGVMQAALQ